MLKCIYISFFSLLVSATVLAGPASEPNAWHATNMTIIMKHVVPAYRNLAATTRQLDDKSFSYCQSPSRPGYVALQQAFHEAMNAWMGVQHMRMGRVELFMRYHRYQLWPDKHNTGSKQLRRLLAEKDSETLQEKNFRSVSVAVQGFTALERVLFASNEAFFKETQNPASYSCQVAKAISHNLAIMSQDLADEWESGEFTPFQKLFVTDTRAVEETGHDTPAYSREAAARFLSLLTTQLEVIADQKLARPLDKSLNKARPRRAESWRSQRSLQNIVRNFESVAHLYQVGFARRVAEVDAGLDKQVVAQFNDIITRARAFRQPLTRIVGDKDQRVQLEQLAQETRELRALVSSKVTRTLDLPQMFNALDGD